MISLPRYLRTIRYLRPAQVAWRARRVVLRGLGWRPRISNVTAPTVLNPSALAGLRAYFLRWTELVPAAEAEALAQGRLVLLNEAVDHGQGWPWHDARRSRLWLYQLHGFEWLRVLRDPGHAAQVSAWMHEWIAQNPPGKGVGWEPYPLAVRLLHWSVLAAGHGVDSPVFRQSMAVQTAYLRRTLEYDVLANHLLVEACALVAGGALTESPAEAEGLALLERELREQVLADGGHYERSAMYQAQVLEACLVAVAVLKESPAWLSEAVVRMADSLEGILHPDGGIPLFGDAVLHAITPPRALAALARGGNGQRSSHEAPGLRAWSATGLCRFESEDRRLFAIFKAGAPGPDYQLGHAHCDALSFELSVDGQRVVVDSGTHGYAGSAWRAFCRSTAAHNTVSIAGRDPMECWDVFRVGRRYSVEAAEAAVPEGWLGCAFTHDGFRPAQHTRQLLFEPRRNWFCVLDTVNGSRAREAQSFLHFHPACAVTPEGRGWCIERGTITMAVLPFGFVRTEIVRGGEHPPQGWYFPDFGVAEPASALVFHAGGTAPLRFGYALAFSITECETALETAGVR